MSPVVGTSRPMIDGRQRVTGQIPYVLNLSLPGMLHAKVLRSQIPHGRIVRVDTAAAEALPGVVVVLSRNDLGPDSGFAPVYGKTGAHDHPAVALDTTRFVGEPIAVVAAVDGEVAEEAVGLIEVEYEDLPAVFDPVEAAQPGAPVIHPELIGQEAAALRGGIREDPARNIAHHFTLLDGDIERGFAESDHVFEDVYTSPVAQQVSLEPHVVVAQAEGRDRVTIWSATQAPWLCRYTVAHVLKIPRDHVRVIVPTLGGGYGGKGDIILEPMTALLSLKAGGRPVKLVLTREEEFVTITKHACNVRIRTGVKRDGTIVARQTELFWSAGAYACSSPTVARNAGAGSIGPYRIPNVRIDSYAVYTNLPSAGPFRGYGVSQAAWASEQQLDKIARGLGMDPLDLRLKNLLVDGDAFATGEVMNDVHWRDLVRAACEKVGWGTPLPVDPTAVKRYGRGCAAIWKVTASPSTSEAKVRLEADGTVSVLTSSVEMGQGVNTALAQIAADAVGVPFEQVRIVHPDTKETPYDLVSASSRATHCVGTATGMASEDAKKKLFQLAADILEANAADLILENGRVFVTGSPDRSLSFAQVLQRAGRPSVEGFGHYTTVGGVDPETGKGIISSHWHQGAGAAEIEVDTETGRVRVLRYHGTSFAGRVVNPMLARLQNEGNVIFGYGPAMFEEMIFDGGQVTNPNLSDYMIPSFLDVPDQLTSESIENPAVGDVHGIGESTLPPVAPAIGNAIAAAVGVEIHDLPMTAERVLRAIKELEVSG